MHILIGDWKTEAINLFMKKLWNNLTVNLFTLDTVFRGHDTSKSDSANNCFITVLEEL